MKSLSDVCLLIYTLRPPFSPPTKEEANSPNMSVYPTIME
jgi:hypothetical protein